MSKSDRHRSDADASDRTVEEQTDSDDYSRRGFLETAGTMAAAGAAASTAGCTGFLGDDSEDTGEQDFLWWTMRGYNESETEAIRDTADGFEDYSDDEVNLTTNVITWDQVFQEWNSAITGQSTPNVSEMAPGIAADFGDQGAVQPNTELFNEFDDWYDLPSYWGEYDGDYWGFPWFIEVRSLMSNMELLNEAGHDSPPETWEELVHVAMDVESETDGSGFGTPGARDNPTGQNVYSLTTQAGGEFFSHDGDSWSVEIDSPASLFAHLWTASLEREWDVTPGGWGGVAGTDLEDLFTNGRVGMALHTSDMARNLVEDGDDLADNIEFSLMAEGPAGNNNTFMGGSCLAAFEEDMTDHDAGTEMSMDFIEYMTMPDSLGNYLPESAPSFLPVREAQEEVEPFSENNTGVPDEWLETRLEQAQQAVRYGVTGGGRNNPALGAIEGDTTAYAVALSGIIGDDQDPKEALGDMANTARDAFDMDEQDNDPSLDDAPDEVQPWINGDGDTPQIWNPYE